MWRHAKRFPPVRLNKPNSDVQIASRAVVGAWHGVHSSLNLSRKRALTAPCNLSIHLEVRKTTKGFDQGFQFICARVLQNGIRRAVTTTGSKMLIAMEPGTLSVAKGWLASTILESTGQRKTRISRIPQRARSTRTS